MPKELSRKPVRNGQIYCSPDCGMGCTYVAYLHATKDTENLVKALGAGWEGDTFENMGWHTAANFDVGSTGEGLRLHKDGTSYTVYMINVPAYYKANTPKKAVAGIKKVVKSLMKRYTTLYNAI